MIFVVLRVLSIGTGVWKLSILGQISFFYLSPKRKIIYKRIFMKYSQIKKTNLITNVNIDFQFKLSFK